MSENKNTYQEILLENGETVKLTLTFARLNLLKSVNNELYTHFNGIMYGKSEDMFDVATVIYIAYWCANYKVGNNTLYGKDEFIELVPFDMIELERLFNALTKPKKK